MNSKQKITIGITLLLAITAAGAWYVTKLAKYQNYPDSTEIPIPEIGSLTESPIDAKPIGQEEVDEMKQKYESSEYTLSTTSSGWDIQNTEGKAIHVEQGRNDHMMLKSFTRFSVDGRPHHVFSNFEDLYLSFFGTTTLHVTADLTRRPDFHTSSAMYLPVTLVNGSEEKIPYISEDKLKVKFCVLDKTVGSLDEYKENYATDVKEITITNLDIKGFDPLYDKSCTYTAYVIN